MKNLRFKKT